MYGLRNYVFFSCNFLLKDILMVVKKKIYFICYRNIGVFFK